MLISLLLLLFFGWWLLKISTAKLQKKDMLLGLFVKMAYSVLFVFVYSNYYGTGALTADTGTFLKESIILKNVFFESPLDYVKFLFGCEDLSMIQHYLSATDHWSSGDLTLVNDAKNVMRINSLIAFFSNGSIWPHITVFSFVSLMGLRELFLAFYNRVNLPPRLFWLILLLFPSLGFWSGSILKEPLMMVGLFLIARAFLDRQLAGVWRLFRLFLGLLLCLMFKPYVVLIVLFVLLIMFFSTKAFRLNSLIGVPLLIGFVVVILEFVPALERPFTKYVWRKQFDFDNVSKGGLHAVDDKQFYYFTVDQYKYIEFYGDTIVVLKKPVHAKIMKLGSEYPFKDAYIRPSGERWINYYSTNRCGSYIPLTSIRNDYHQLLKNCPEALINATLRPFPTDPGGNMIWFNFIETIGLVVFCVYMRWKSGFYIRHKQLPLWVVLVVSSIGVLLLIGWTTPVLGAIARYRVPAYLMLFLSSILSLKNETSNSNNRS